MYKDKRGSYAHLLEKYQALKIAYDDLLRTNETLDATLTEVSGRSNLRQFTAKKAAIEPQVGMVLRGFQLPPMGVSTPVELQVGDVVVRAMAKHTEHGLSVQDAISLRTVQTFGLNEDGTQATAKLPESKVQALVNQVRSRHLVAEPV